MASVAFRGYSARELATCLALFDGNCPDYFAPNERHDYEEFLRAGAPGYLLCERDSRIVGAFGLGREPGGLRVQWIMISPDAQGTGLGTAMMTEALARAWSAGAQRLFIAASHKSAPFFARFGAHSLRSTPDGWGPGMHRIDMQLELTPLATG